MKTGLETEAPFRRWFEVDLAFICLSRMDSFFLAEMFKYLYLLFSEKSQLPIDIDDYVFTTEAHLLPVSLSTAKPSCQGNNTVRSDLHDSPTKTLCLTELGGLPTQWAPENAGIGPGRVPHDESESSASVSQEAGPVFHEDDLFSHSCPSMETLFPNNPSFAKTIRDGYKYLTGVGRAFHPLPVRLVRQQGRVQG